MSWVRKIGYYAYSTLEIILNFKDWHQLIPLFVKRADHDERVVRLRRPPVTMIVRSAMDVWSIKETFLDAFYTRYGVPVQDGWTVIDIGAAIGDFSIYAAYGNPNARIYAFEPFPESYQLLIKNLSLNALENVTAFQEAIWGQSGRLSLEVSTGEPLQVTSQKINLNGENPELITVAARTLANVIDALNLQTVDLLKLDCEGAEYEILMTAPAETFAKIPRIIMEYHDLDREHTHVHLIDFLMEKGYQVDWHKNLVHEEIGYLFASKMTPED